MTSSIVLSAYKGGLYLREQLDSIVTQTVLPDELIIINDASPDNGETEHIIDDYARKYRFVKKKNNKTNLGWAESFMRGAGVAEGEIIMFSDQDDIWEQDKIEKTIKCFDDPTVNAVICDCINVDENLNILQSHQGTGKLERTKFAFDKHFIYPKGVGAAMAVRKEIIERYKDCWNPGFGHDRFIQVILMMFYSLDFLDVPLIKHRMHGDNATGHKVFDAQMRVATIEGNLKFLDEIKKYPEYSELPNGKKEILDSYYKFACHRRDMLQNKSVFQWLLMPAYDISFYPTRNTWLGDLKSITNRG